MRFSLRSFLVLPFLFLFLSAAVLIGWAGFRAGQESLEQFQRQMAAETGVRISAHLDRFFSSATHVALTNAESLRSGRLDAQRAEDLQRHFVGQMRHLPYLTFVSFGRADGQYVGATRLLDTNEVRVMTSLRSEGMTIDTFAVDDDNARATRLRRGPAFDARTRVWFRRAVDDGKVGWYPVYKYAPYDSLGVGVSVPVHDAQGRFLGVATGDVALVQIGRYLRAQSIGRSGFAFVAEPDGKLVASSLPDPVFRIDGEQIVRLAVAEHADSRLRAVGVSLEREPLQSGQRFLEVEGERLLLDLRRFHDAHGLELIVGVLLPERDYATTFHANLKLVAWLTLGIAAIGALLGVILSGWLVRPLSEINRRAERIAAGEWAGDVDANSSIREFSELGRSFNTMAASLRNAFSGLEARVAERTRALELANSELERIATLDGLTHIANRRRFDTVLLQEWRRCLRERKPMSLLMLDVDDFKAYNDEYGHQAGDDVLIRIAALCEGSMKRPTDTVARYGGEEFAVILAQTDADGALSVATEIAQHIRDLAIPHRRATAVPIVTVSIGVATLVPETQVGPNALIGSADRALYAAKRAGRNRIEVAQ
ncbi:MAG: diguanylate cyclase [Rhodocyclaceae bacterium]|nr:diguanylate cyclase [Rhodocyclaceae bacterium]